MIATALRSKLVFQRKSGLQMPPVLTLSTPFIPWQRKPSYLVKSLVMQKQLGVSIFSLELSIYSVVVIRFHGFKEEESRG